MPCHYGHARDTSQNFVNSEFLPIFWSLEIVIFHGNNMCPDFGNVVNDFGDIVMIVTIVAMISSMSLMVSMMS
jgi:hypothetical protein